jgi:hypothetical protein
MEEQQDSSSPNYHKWLHMPVANTPIAFGLSQDDLADL